MMLVSGCRSGHKTALWLGVLGFWAVWTDPASAQLRVVSYNTLHGTTASDIIEPLKVVLQSLAESERNGISKPIDVLLLQEQNSASSDTQKFVNHLNSVYGAGTYARGFVNGGPPTSFIRQTIVYNTETVQLLDELAFGNTAGSTNQERQTLRYQLRPVGYDSSADFYAYNSHYKSSLDGSPPGANATQRNSEAVSIRANSDALGVGTHAIYAGDHNFYYSDFREPAWGTLTAAGAGQAHDPINRVGSWHNNPGFADVHTQSPCASGCPGGFATGGMDDRFDFQLVTGEFLDNEGLSYIAGSYHAFGNNGTTYNTNINSAGNTVTFSGVTSHTKAEILNALHSGSDHLPVVADYQLPAILNAMADAVPATLLVGEDFDLEITVGNVDAILNPAVPVDFANGADELDYDLTTSGDVLGEFLNQIDAALGSMNSHFVSLDTSTPGMKSGLITIASTSQAVQNALVEIPISYEVLPDELEGDHNEDGFVDAADYVLWRSDPSSYGGAQGYTDWVDHFGNTGSGGSLGAAVPEPGSWLLLVVGVCVAAMGRGRLKG